jgi:predicted NUDIX family NTP pyrophosphohydrolase
MAKKQSAGIILYRFKEEQLEIFLVHPGGPFFKNKDEGSWSIPKGEFQNDENALDAARREFEEETGVKLSGDFKELSPIRQKGGKVVYAWALPGDIDADNIRSNTFSIQWPPKSNTLVMFPEIDRAAWFISDIACIKINPSQVGLIKDLKSKLGIEF